MIAKSLEAWAVGFDQRDQLDRAKAAREVKAAYEFYMDLPNDSS